MWWGQRVLECRAFRERKKGRLVEFMGIVLVRNHDFHGLPRRQCVAIFICQLLRCGWRYENWLKDRLNVVLNSTHPRAITRNTDDIVGLVIEALSRLTDSKP